MPTRYRINVWKISGNERMFAKGQWQPFESYKDAEAYRIEIRDIFPAYQVTIEYCWQD